MTERKRPDPLAMIAKLDEEEKKLSETTFLAPIVAGGKVRVRVAGIIYEMNLTTEDSGWCILRMVSPGQAEVIEQAPLSMVGKYLELFPRVRFVLIDEIDEQWWGLQASASDSRIQLTGPAPIQLHSGGTNFDTINTRFDGTSFWYESVDRRRDPVIARTLRKALENNVVPDEVRATGMVPQERLAYRMMYLHKHRDDPSKQDERARISEALRMVGAELDSFSFDRNDRESAWVRFTLDGNAHMVQVRASDLSIQSSGVCLRGRDREFDLTSIVSVFRERNRRFGYTGEFDDHYEDYWEP